MSLNRRAISRAIGGGMQYNPRTEHRRRASMREKREAGRKRQLCAARKRSGLYKKGMLLSFRLWREKVLTVTSCAQCRELSEEERQVRPIPTMAGKSTGDVRKKKKGRQVRRAGVLGA
mmetsp:Transcript_26529/g.81570  ORF Transcript_26529/g.81570 Transcript_26529/m.81570 type:complete len:118 (-) Transcript_26529:99-452(-)